MHPTHVVATCARCHADAKRMKPYGVDPGIPDAWRGSVHAAQLAKGDLSAPECATCHGSHGAIPPGFRTVGAVCGKCHTRERELFESSPHAPLVAQEEFPGCEACHGNHAIQPASLEIYDRMCNLCHGGDDQTLARRDRIQGDLRGVQELLASSEAELQRTEKLGLVTDDDRLLLEEGRTDARQASVVQHTLDPAKVAEITGPAREALQQLTDRLRGERRDARLRRIATLPVVAFLLVMALGAWVRYRRIHRRS